MIDLGQVVQAFASGLVAADSLRPEWTSVTTGRSYLPGIGPHPEAKTVELVLREMARMNAHYAEHRLGVPYPSIPRQRCDLLIDAGAGLAVEVKMLRFLGDNGKTNDNILMHLLSPYPAHRSALTDVSKLARSGFPVPKALLIYGYDYDDWPMDPAIGAFEMLANPSGLLGARCEAKFSDLVHPVHTRGRVFGWTVADTAELDRAPRVSI